MYHIKITLLILAKGYDLCTSMKKQFTGIGKFTT